MIFDHLDWDSTFFKLKIGKLTLNNGFKPIELARVLQEKKEKGYDLIYGFDEFCQENILKKQPISIRSEFSFSIISTLDFSSEIIKEYRSSKLTESLKLLALQSGHFSRFKLDSNFRNNEFEKLYQAWIKNSIDGVMADKVIIAEQNKETQGMITMKIARDYCEIGLLAVDESFRGKKIGYKLLEYAVALGSQLNKKAIIVSTQQANNGAFRFYLNNGFELKQETFIYHFWLNNNNDSLQ